MPLCDFLEAKMERHDRAILHGQFDASGTRTGTMWSRSFVWDADIVIVRAASQQESKRVIGWR